MTTLAGLGLVLLALLGAGCAGGTQAAPPASAPGSGAPDSPETQSGPELRKTERGEEPEQPAFGSPGYAQPPQMSLDDAESLLDRDSKDLATALSTAKDCATARKALESMKRSANRICELNGPSDPRGRCAQARDRVEAAHENVRRGCPP